MWVKFVALAYISVAIVGGWAVLRLCFAQDARVITFLAASWIALTVTVLFAPHFVILVIVLAIIVARFQSMGHSHRLMLFVALLPAVPSSTGWTIPFPGLEHLYVIYYSTLLGILALLPLVFARRPRDPEWRLISASPVWLGAIGFIVLCGLLDFRETTLTNGIRSLFHNLVSTGLIVAAISRASINDSVLRQFLLGMVVAGVFLSSIALMQYATGWYLYDQMSSMLRTNTLFLPYAFQTRGAQLRVPSTMSPISLGIYLALCCLACVGLMSVVLRKGIAAWIIALFVFVIYLTDARASLIALTVALLVYLLFSERMKRIRRLSILLVVTTVSLVAMGVDVEEWARKVDTHGTWVYRIDLLRNSLDPIRESPILGSPSFTEHPSLERSRQGQGIIDIVNSYLGIALQYGLLGLAWFLILTLRSVGAVWGQLSASVRLESRVHRSHVRALVAMSVGMLFAIATVSLIDVLDEYLWILLAVSFATSIELARQNGDQVPMLPSKTTG